MWKTVNLGISEHTSYTNNLVLAQFDNNNFGEKWRE